MNLKNLNSILIFLASVNSAPLDNPSFLQVAPTTVPVDDAKAFISPSPSPSPSNAVDALQYNDPNSQVYVQKALDNSNQKQKILPNTNNGFGFASDKNLERGIASPIPTDAAMGQVEPSPSPTPFLGSDALSYNDPNAQGFIQKATDSSQKQKMFSPDAGTGSAQGFPTAPIIGSSQAPTDNGMGDPNTLGSKVGQGSPQGSFPSSQLPTNNGAQSMQSSYDPSQGYPQNGGVPQYNNEPIAINQEGDIPNFGTPTNNNYPQQFPVQDNYPQNIGQGPSQSEPLQNNQEQQPPVSSDKAQGDPNVAPAQMPQSTQPPSITVSQVPNDKEDVLHEILDELKKMNQKLNGCQNCCPVQNEQPSNQVDNAQGSGQVDNAKGSGQVDNAQPTNEVDNAQGSTPNDGPKAQSVTSNDVPSDQARSVTPTSQNGNVDAMSQSPSPSPDNSNLAFAQVPKSETANQQFASGQQSNIHDKKKHEVPSTLNRDALAAPSPTRESLSASSTPEVNNSNNNTAIFSAKSTIGSAPLSSSSSRVAPSLITLISIAIFCF